LAETEKSDPHAARFRAFVSYSHADAAIAQKLHKKIETYRLPDHLRDQQISDPDNGRLGRIFRDREDLPAAADLSESVKQALAGSQALIVICSPDAKASIWVAREIELFRALHPDRPVLAALVRGEPEEAFPAPLLEGVEPLAADLRKEGDGWRLGFLKIVAGIAEVPLDALVQRDATRRIRRVMVVTGGALVALLAMIGMTIFAVQSRNEAQHQQAEAEGLVEYMLTDLRTELKGVGRLDVMTKVNERAMDYYEDQGDLSDMPAESLERRARILHAMGEDDEKRGDLDKALAKFTEAHRVTEALLARDPDNPDRIFGHAQSEYWVGYVAYLKKDWETAERYWQGYKKYADQLVAADNQNMTWLREAGYAEGNLCTLFLSTKHPGTLDGSHCEESFRHIKRVINATGRAAADLVNLANRHAWLADYHVLGKRFEKALGHRNQELSIYQELQGHHPENSIFEAGILNSLTALAQIDIVRSDRSKAIIKLKSAHDRAKRLAELEPDNHRWVSSKANLGNLITDISNDDGETK
jgi:tetratricopeptide (TPR) repeat protein